jgi:hypothetical protein
MDATRCETLNGLNPSLRRRGSEHKRFKQRRVRHLHRLEASPETIRASTASGVRSSPAVAKRTLAKMFQADAAVSPNKVLATPDGSLRGVASAKRETNP